MHGARLKQPWLALFLLGIVVPQIAAGTIRVDQPATWTVRNCDEVRKAIFEWPQDVLIAHAQGRRVVEIRVSGEFVPDVQILLHKAQTATFFSVVTVADGGVCQQLRRLKRMKPHLTVEEAKALIETKRRTGTASANDALSARFDALKGIRVTPWPRATLYHPSRTTQVKISGMLEEITVTFQEPEPLAEKVAFSGDAPDSSQSALAAWVEGVVETLDISVLGICQTSEAPHRP